MDHIADLQRDGLALLDAARAAGLRAPVAACPGWDVSRLVSHTGKVLERTTILVREGLDAPPGNDRYDRFPDAESAFDRFAAVLDDTVAALAEADPDGSCWNFTGNDLTTRFWVRRMANEVAIHRADAEIAADALQPVGPERAVDANDELVCEVVADEQQAITAVLREEMSGACPLAVPLEVSVGAGANWDAAAH